MTEYNIDICDTGDIMQKFCDKYNMNEIEDYQTIFSIFFDKYYDTKINKPENISRKYCDIKDISIGDYIHVQYICYSQRHNDSYENIEGHVIYVDDNKKNGLIYSEADGVRNINSIEKDYCSYYGNTPGYCCYITK